ncbi:hypothetical protein OG21DRAFT_1526187 [Imleria badia]|nr:hypothetical protein OG21DRAFT_1526187 [Imleria badia]
MQELDVRFSSLVGKHEIPVSRSEVQVLKPQPHVLVPFSTWKQIFQAGVDIILISQYSFWLYKQHIPQSFSSAAQRYKASETHGRVKKGLEEVFKQFGKTSFDEKVDIVTDLILCNHKTLTD